MYLFLAAPSLRCFAQALSGCGGPGLTLVSCVAPRCVGFSLRGLLAAEQRLAVCEFQQVRRTGSATVALQSQSSAQQL